MFIFMHDLHQRFGNVLDAFHPYHLGTSNEVDLEAFQKMLAPFNFKPYDIQNVFDWLDMRNRKRLRGDAIEFAKVGNPAKLSHYARNSAERKQDDVLYCHKNPVSTSSLSLLLFILMFLD